MFAHLKISIDTCTLTESYDTDMGAHFQVSFTMTTCGLSHVHMDGISNNYRVCLTTLGFDDQFYFEEHCKYAFS